MRHDAPPFGSAHTTVRVADIPTFCERSDLQRDRPRLIRQKVVVFAAVPQPSQERTFASLSADEIDTAHPPQTHDPTRLRSAGGAHAMLTIRTDAMNRESLCTHERKMLIAA